MSNFESRILQYFMEERLEIGFLGTEFKEYWPALLINSIIEKNQRFRIIPNREDYEWGQLLAIYDCPVGSRISKVNVTGFCAVRVLIRQLDNSERTEIFKFRYD
jgi:hypothetical protein